MSEAMEDTGVAIIGAGVCGLLAAQQCSEQGFSYKIIEREQRVGGVWKLRANAYSQLQAYAALYQWHAGYRLDSSLFGKVGAGKVLQTLHNFAKKESVGGCIRLGTEVTSVRDLTDSRFSLVCRDVTSGASTTLTADAVLVCTGILGDQVSAEARGVLGIKDFTGEVVFASRQHGADCTLGDAGHMQYKDVVILGTGAFALEAMEAAHRGQARNITLLSSPRDRWVVPFSKQFAFIALSHAPLPRAWRCWLLDMWLRHLYWFCMIEHMAPPRASARRFTGQCSDAFFKLTHRNQVKYVVDKVAGIDRRRVKLRSGRTLNADILVVALGCEVQRQPTFLKEMGVGFNDLQNFVFLGASGRLGAACDWVWFNVPQGPQKQIECFLHAYRAWRAGKGKEVQAALRPTPFTACMGESLAAANPSLLAAHERAWLRTMAVGRTWAGKAALLGWQRGYALCLWLLCVYMALVEWYTRGDWLQQD